MLLDFYANKDVYIKPSNEDLYINPANKNKSYKNSANKDYFTNSTIKI